MAKMYFVCVPVILSDDLLVRKCGLVIPYIRDGLQTGRRLVKASQGGWVPMIPRHKKKGTNTAA